MKNRLFVWILIFILGRCNQVMAQDWQSDISRLKHTGSVMFLGYSPEDFDHRFSKYLLDDERIRVGFLSLTRGENSDIDAIAYPMDGVQRGIYHVNKAIASIGKFYSDLYFTRTYDFLSNNKEDSTFLFEKHWDKMSIMGDIVWQIRTFRPDIIVFPSYKNLQPFGKRYFALQMMAEAVKIASDSNFYKEQFDDNRYPNHIVSVLALDSIHGTYDLPIAFGNIKYDLITGTKPNQTIRNGIVNDWSRIYESIDKGYYNKYLDSITTLQWTKEEQLNALLHLKDKLSSTAYMDGYLRSYKDQQLDDMIFRYSGVKASVNFEQPFLVLGKPYRYTINVDRNGSSFQLQYFKFGKFDTAFNQSFDTISIQKEFVFPKTETVYQPYWMASKMATPGMYEIGNRNDLNSPTNYNPFGAKFIFNTNGKRFEYLLPAFHLKQDSTKEIPIVTIPGFTNVAPFMILTHVFPTRKSEKIHVQLQPNFSQMLVPLSINIIRKGIVIKREGGFSGGEKQEILLTKDTVANLENGKSLNWSFDIAQKVLDTLHGDIGAEIWIGKEPNRIKANSSLVHIPLKGLPDIDYHYQPSIGLMTKDTFKIVPKTLIGLYEDSVTNPTIEYLKIILSSLHLDYKIINQKLGLDSLKLCKTIIAPMSLQDSILSSYVSKGGKLLIVPSRTDSLPKFIKDSISFTPYNLMVSNASLFANIADSLPMFRTPNNILPDQFPQSGTISTINWHSDSLQQMYVTPMIYNLTKDATKESIRPLLMYQYGKGTILLSGLYIDAATLESPFVYKFWANVLSSE
ncbi:MAG: hypothetical protein DI598_02065 [Pseudopedobacter saltans]|uniref:Uncharacterized protein n=1 Tax=Pseudopedobacter saltans TaxID=151895 RepID=A0A2W5H1J6_9SPHI|nr:MAG: hypothetical protein DI598_02065 [Pseudopedobacter saltans]